MVMWGMDVQEIRNVGAQLKSQAQQIDQVISTIDGLIGTAIGNWTGHDADQFQDWWNSQHKPALQNAREAIDGLGQSAINNASEQESVSGH